MDNVAGLSVAASIPAIPIDTQKEYNFVMVLVYSANSNGEPKLPILRVDVADG
jgi:hypothetical protein